jgi:hypothetical protein
MTTKVNEADPITNFMRAIRDMLRDPSSGDYNFGVAREGLRKADLSELAKAAEHINSFVERAAAHADAHDGQRVDRTDNDSGLSVRDKFLLGTRDMWKTKEQRELDRRGDAALSPRDRFIVGTADMSISKRARERGFDG